MPKYLVFSTLQQAENAAQSINAMMGLTAPQYNKNAASGATDFNSQPTICWAKPTKTANGQWVIPSPNNDGVEADDTWFPKITEA